jgi:3,4-dihydroxy-2-butanone 4-phosphate synthase
MQKVIEDIQNGVPVIVVDDFDREFEGDLVIAAEKADRHNTNFRMNGYAVFGLGARRFELIANQEVAT